jgi:hypothetical protein
MSVIRYSLDRTWLIPWRLQLAYVIALDTGVSGYSSEGLASYGAFSRGMFSLESYRSELSSSIRHY